MSLGGGGVSLSDSLRYKRDTHKVYQYTDVAVKVVC